VAGVLAVSDNFLNSRRDQIISLASRHSIAMMYPFRADAAAGGLLSFARTEMMCFAKRAFMLAEFLRAKRLENSRSSSPRGSI